MRSAGYEINTEARTITQLSTGKAHDFPPGVDVPSLVYDEKSGLRALGIALRSTLDGREQGRWVRTCTANHA